MIEAGLLSRRGASAIVPWAVAAVVWMAGPVWAEDAPVADPYARIAEANRAFAEGRFDQALGGYDSAAEVLGDVHSLDYNRAAAFYKLGDYAKAAELFARAALSENPDLSRRARFGWGNCDYAEALSKLQPADAQADPQVGQSQDMQGAIDRLQSAQRHYRDALSAEGPLPADHPADRDARGNIERAEGLIEAIQQMMQQQQQQQQGGDQDQDSQNDEQQKDQQQQDKQQQKDGEQQQQNEQQESDPDQQQQEQQQGQQEQEQDPQQEDQAQQSQAQQDQDDSQKPDAEQKPQPDEMRENGDISQDEIEAILQSVRDKEKQRREEKRRRLQARRQPVAEDW